LTNVRYGLSSCLDFTRKGGSMLLELVDAGVERKLTVARTLLVTELKREAQLAEAQAEEIVVMDFEDAIFREVLLERCRTYNAALEVIKRRLG